MINRGRIVSILGLAGLGGIPVGRPLAALVRENMEPVPNQEPPRVPIKNHRRKTDGSRDYGTRAERIRAGKW